MNGKTIINKNPKEALEHGISMIHQELNPVLDMQVFENVYIGRELKTKLGLIDKQTMINETKSLLNSMKLNISPTAYMRDLSVAERQLVEILKAVSVNAKVVIMDEPTSAITDKEIDVLFEQINVLRSNGVSIIYISHKMDEIFKISDRITVLRDGELIGTDYVSNFDNQKLIRMMVGRDLNDVYPKAEVNIGDVVFEAKNISYKDKVKNVSFQLHSGEILGIAGLVGAGRSELVETIFGSRQKTEGHIFKNGKELIIKHPHDAIKHNIALLTEDRKYTGLNLIGTVKENITIVSLGDIFSKHGLINKKTEIAKSKYIVDELRIKTPDINTQVGNLSGGNQQKVVVAKWLQSEPDVIIFDEPTRGIDVGAKRDIYVLIGEFVKAGKSVIVISSETPELIGICDRIIVMAGGKLTGELNRKDFSQEKIMEYAAKFNNTEEI
jgi:ABC-type sugar transport system ATPase subunit